MKIALISDLHLEYGNTLPDPVDAKVLVVAGDLANGHREVANALASLSKQYEHVLYVPGNNEYHGSNICDFDKALANDLKPLKNVHNLNNKQVKIEDVTFIGATFWPNFNYNPLAMLAARTMIKDFSIIGNFSPEYSVQLHYRSLDFIKFAYSENAGKKVIVTHFPPAKQCIPSISSIDALASYFSNDYADHIEHLEDTTWLFGHNHEPIDTTIGTTRLVSNPHGYEHKPYNPKCLTI